jgi:hypothetical protein
VGLALRLPLENERVEYFSYQGTSKNPQVSFPTPAHENRVCRGPRLANLGHPPDFEFDRFLALPADHEWSMELRPYYSFQLPVVGQYVVPGSFAAEHKLVADGHW